MKRTSILTAATLFAASFAFAGASYKISVTSPVTVGDTQLKAGDYKVSVENNKATFKSGSSVVEVPASLVTGDQKYEYTTLGASGTTLSEIRLGGTMSKIVITPSTASAGASK